jgi:hypothetical protein
MAESNDGGVVEFEFEVTEVDTAVHATEEWISGYEQGERRGVAKLLDALRVRLRRSGATVDEMDAVVERLRADCDLDLF